MSLANLFVRGDRAYLQADAGTWWSNGEVASIESKMHSVEGLPIALTARGTICHDTIRRTLAENPFNSPEEFLAGVPDLMRATEQSHNAEFFHPMLSCWYIAAYLPSRGRCCGYLMTNYRDWFAGRGIEPFRTFAVSHSIGAIVPASEMLGREVDLANPASFDVTRDSLELIRAQRAIPWAEFPVGTDPGAVVATRIGGWVDQAEVSESGVKVSRLIDWPEDRVGKRIAA